jgi:hypothetical protein
VLQRFTERGELLAEIRRTNDFVPSADEKIRIAVNGRRVSVERRAYPVAFYVRELADGSLTANANLANGGDFVTDVFGPAYDLRSSWLGVPPGLRHVRGNLFATASSSPNSASWVGLVRVSGLDR